MEFLSFAFCESVCQILKYQELLCVNRIRSEFWKRAAAETSDRRVNVALNISYGTPSSQPRPNNNITWMYELKVLDVLNQVKQSFTFAELQNLDRQHLQVSQVNIGFSPQQISSLEEINEIVQFTLPFLANTSLAVYKELSDNEETWLVAISTMLSLYQNVLFSSLYCSDSSRSLAEFLIKQLEESTASSFHLSLSSLQWSEDLRLAVEEFAISKPFASLTFYKAFMFSRAFFERLFEKPITRSEFQFDGEFSFDFTELQGFKTEIQYSVTEETMAYQNIVWRRVDGVQVKATRLYNNHWSIRWSRIQ